MIRDLWDGILGWYETLPRARQNAVDQALHVAAGFVISSVGTAVAAWGWAHWREFVKQWSIERIRDTQEDMRSVIWGAIPGQVVFLVWFGVLCSAVF